MHVRRAPWSKTRAWEDAPSVKWTPNFSILANGLLMAIDMKFSNNSDCMKMDNKPYNCFHLSRLIFHQWICPYHRSLMMHPDYANMSVYLHAIAIASSYPASGCWEGNSQAFQPSFLNCKTNRSLIGFNSSQSTKMSRKTWDTRMIWKYITKREYQLLQAMKLQFDVDFEWDLVQRNIVLKSGLFSYPVGWIIHEVEIVWHSWMAL